MIGLGQIENASEKIAGVCRLAVNIGWFQSRLCEPIKLKTAPVAEPAMERSAGLPMVRAGVSLVGCLDSRIRPVAVARLVAELETVG